MTRTVYKKADTLFGEWLGIPLEVPVKLIYIKKFPNRFRNKPDNWYRIEYYGQTLGNIHLIKATTIDEYNAIFSIPEKPTDDCIIEYRDADKSGGMWCGRQDGHIGDRVNEIFTDMIQTGGFLGYKKEYWKPLTEVEHED